MTEENSNESQVVGRSSQKYVASPILTQGCLSGLENVDLGIDIRKGEIGHNLHERERADIYKIVTKSPIFEARKWNAFILDQQKRLEFLVGLRDSCLNARTPANNRTAQKAEVEIRDIEKFFANVNTYWANLRELQESDFDEFLSFFGEERSPDPWARAKMQLSGFGYLTDLGKKILKAVNETADERGLEGLEWVGILHQAIYITRQSFGLPDEDKKDPQQYTQFALRPPGGRIHCPYCGERHTHGVPDGFRSPHCRKARPIKDYYVHTVPKGALNE